MLVLGFIVLTVFMLVLVYWAVSKVSGIVFNDAISSRKFRWKAALILDAWLVYITVTSLAGVYNSTAMPPRIPLLLVLPTFGFMVFLLKNVTFRKLLAALPAQWLVYAQSFRIAVELLLLGLSLKGKVPVEATFEGYNYDIIIGLTAPIIGWLAFRGNKVNKPLLRLWNYFGFLTLFVVVFVFMSQAYLPSIWHKQESIISMGFGLFPYTYLAGFLMPLAVFMHICSLVKMKEA